MLVAQSQPEALVSQPQSGSISQPQVGSTSQPQVGSVGQSQLVFVSQPQLGALEQSDFFFLKLNNLLTSLSAALNRPFFLLLEQELQPQADWELHVAQLGFPQPASTLAGPDSMNANAKQKEAKIAGLRMVSTRRSITNSVTTRMRKSFVRCNRTDARRTCTTFDTSDRDGLNCLS